MSTGAEAAQEQVSKNVEATLGHLRNNQTTEREARNLRDAADKSLSDHATAKSIGRLP